MDAVCLSVLSVALAVAQPAPKLHGYIRTRGNAPIAGATIVLDGVGLAAVSDSLGYYQVAVLQAGRHSVLARKPGFSPATLSVAVTDSEPSTADFQLDAIVQALPDVTVKGAAPGRKLEGFEERRHIGIGHFLTQADVEKAAGMRMSEKVRHLPGLQVVFARTGGSVRIATSRGPVNLSGSPCWVTMMIDGVVVENYDINSLDSDEVAAIEWYAGPSQIPVQFNKKGSCGLLVIWTK